MTSQTEENYLKAIFKLSGDEQNSVSTSAISNSMNTSAASVTDMLKRLSEKGFINYAKYKGVTLTENGQKLATNLTRKHRLWEVFLVNKLQFSWDEVHDMAEELEHIKSNELINRLDKYLGFPRFDPHGDPIPDADGNIQERKQILLSEIEEGEHGVLVGVNEHTTPFLQYLDRLELGLGAHVSIIEKFAFDNSMKIKLNKEKELILTSEVSKNLFVQKQ